MGKGGAFIRWRGRYTAEDVRFTRSKNASVTLFGYEKPLAFTIGDNKRPGRLAYAFKLTGFTTSVHEDAKAGYVGGSVKLPVEKAVLEGDRVDVETKIANRSNIGFWDNPEEKALWLVKILRAGTYQVSGEFAATSAGWENPKKTPIGEVAFKRAGVYHVVLKPAEPRKWKCGGWS